MIYISLDLIFQVYKLLEGKRQWRAEDERVNSSGHPRQGDSQKVKLQK